jgi:hypothetical protein
LVQQFLYNRPLTFSSLFSLAVNAGGTAYTVGDMITVAGGTKGTAMVTNISGGGSTGPVTVLAVIEGGVGYINGATGISTTGGTGTNLKVNTFTSSDPAFSNADWVMQTILAPPFAWRWNRVGGSPSLPTFVTIVGTTDYEVALPAFGWLEKAVAYDPSSGYYAFELSNELVMGAETLPNQPTRISAQYDDGAGNITFRITPAPDKVYNVVVDYQQSAPQFSSLTQTWVPIPDYLSYLVNEGFFAKGAEYCNDPRNQEAMQLFLTDLAAVSEGLSQTQKNLWLTSKINSMRQTMTAQQGRG